jgi:hypothetical protein
MEGAGGSEAAIVRLVAIIDAVGRTIHADRPLRSLVKRGDGQAAQLEEWTEEIRRGVVFDDQTVDEAVEGEDIERHDLVRCRDAEPFAALGPDG